MQTNWVNNSKEVIDGDAVSIEWLEEGAPHRITLRPRLNGEHVCGEHSGGDTCLLPLGHDGSHVPCSSTHVAADLILEP